MKKFFALLACAISITFSSVAFAADNFSVWSSQEFLAPFTDNTIAVSDPIANSSGDNSVKLFVSYEAVSHGGTYPNVCECDIRVILEEEIATGVWVPVATQGQEFRILDNSPTRMLLVTPALSWNENYSVQLADGSDMKVTRMQGKAPAAFRVRLALTEYVADTVTSVKVSVHGRKFSE